MGSTVWEKKMVGKQLPSSSSSSSSAFFSPLPGSLLWGTGVQFDFKLGPFTRDAASVSFSSSEDEDDVSSPLISALSDNLKKNCPQNNFSFLPDWSYKTHVLLLCTNKQTKTTLTVFMYLSCSSCSSSSFSSSSNLAHNSSSVMMPFLLPPSMLSSSCSSSPSFRSNTTSNLGLEFGVWAILCLPVEADKMERRLFL